MLAIRKDVFVFVINTFLGSLSVWVCPVVSNREMMNSKFSLNISLKLNILHHVYQKWNILLPLCHKLHGKKEKKQKKKKHGIVYIHSTFMIFVILSDIEIFNLRMTRLLKLPPIPLPKSSLKKLCLESTEVMGKDLRAIVGEYHLDLPHLAAEVYDPFLCAPSHLPPSLITKRLKCVWRSSPLHAAGVAAKHWASLSVITSSQPAWANALIRFPGCALHQILLVITASDA